MSQDLRSVVRTFDRAQEEEQTANYAAQKGLGYVNLVNYPFVGDVLGIIPEEIAIKYKIVAFLKVNHEVRVAAVDPFVPGLAEVMSRLGAELDVSFQPYACSLTSINYALSRYQLLVP